MAGRFGGVEGAVLAGRGVGQLEPEEVGAEWAVTWDEWHCVVVGHAQELVVGEFEFVRDVILDERF